MRPRLALAAFLALGTAGVVWAVVDPANGGLATLLAAFALVAGGFAWLEQGGDTARDLTLVATLGGIAAAGRVLFVPIPNVQPVTVIVAAAGVALGPRRGFAVGALAAIASNMFLGQGAHTPWQMLAWGGCGVLAGVFRRHAHHLDGFAFFERRDVLRGDTPCLEGEADFVFQVVIPAQRLLIRTGIDDSFVVDAVFPHRVSLGSFHDFAPRIRRTEVRPICT